MNKTAQPVALLAMALIMGTAPIHVGFAEVASPPDPQAVQEIARRVADYELQRREESNDNSWIRATFYTGQMATWRLTGDQRYLDEAMRWGEANSWAPRAGRHADNHTAGQTYLELYQLKHEPEMLEPIRRTFDRMMVEPKRGREEWSWCDALYMAPPTLARLAAATGDRRYLIYMNELWWDAADLLFDQEAGLFYRDSNYFERRTRNGHKVFWSRGNGWVMGGLVRVLEHLPAGDPHHGHYVELLQTMAEAVARVQGDDGLWRTSLLDAEHFPEPETSGSGFFCFSLAWGINHGYLDRQRFLPVVLRAWEGLTGAVNSDGRLGYVQPVAASPGLVDPDGTYDYAVGAFLLAGSEVARLRELRFDFGGGPTASGHAPITAGTLYNSERGYGWIDPNDLADRDRGWPDALLRDLILGRAAATFRVDLPPGIYRMTLVSGDMQFADHVLDVSIDGQELELPRIANVLGEFITLRVAFGHESDHLLIRFNSPVNNWVANALVLEPAEEPAAPALTSERHQAPVRDTWTDVRALPDPIAAYVEQFRQDLAVAPPIRRTGLSRDDYLRVIESNIDYFKALQNEDGAIIDPYREVEFQYSTPCFALAAAAVVAHGGREDLLEPAAKAMDHATIALSRRQAATAHEDFYAPVLAHALPLLKPLVDEARAARWEQNLRSFDPHEVYRASRGGNNWNVVALSGEALLHQQGIREDMTWAEVSLGAQGRFFASPWGLYTEGPMAYDLFPRMWAADMVAAGYSGRRVEELREALRRGALTSLFMQSPTGELPAGGRSAHHQWNEAQQCVMFEIYAAQAKRARDQQLAGAFKRAARLSLGSMQRWVRPSGELWIVKNRLDPAERHGYEGYSAHSQYNLLAMAMLAMAYAHAEPTEDVPELPAPADVGGFVIHVEPVFRKVFANAGGMYVQIDTAGDMSHNPTGLLRIHRSGANPQLGPSDGLVERPAYQLPDGPRRNVAVGAAWRDINGEWRSLADHSREHMQRTSLLDVQQSPQRVAFQLIYQGYFSGPAMVAERYVVTPDAVELTVELPGYSGPRRMIWPVLVDDGEEQARLEQTDNTVTVSFRDSSQVITAPDSGSVRVQEERYAHRNGWARVVVAEYDADVPMKVRIELGPGGGEPARTAQRQEAN
jgi:rhamnogalacturonyl hydrolase YesR